MRRRNVGYIRVANKSDDAVENQKVYINEYAKRNNFKIDYYYIDNGYSGNNLDRPGLRQMIRDVKSRKITDRIIFKDVSRLGRDLTVTQNIVNQLSKRDVKLVSINGDMETLDIMSVIMKMFREDQKKRKKQAQEFKEKKLKEMSLL